MEILFEILLNIVLEPIVWLFIKPVEDDLEGVGRRKIPTAVKVILISMFMVVFIAMFLFIIFGAILLATGDGEDDKRVGLITLLIGVVLLIAYIILVIVRLNIKKKKESSRPRNKAFNETVYYAKRAAFDGKDGSPHVDDSRSDKPSNPKLALRRLVHVIVDRPLGSTHPEHSDIVYTVNYGYVVGETGGDGEAQDAYILGADEPIEEFDGVVVAVIHRLNDNEDKWVVAPRGSSFTVEEIEEKTKFQEKYFETEIITN